MRFSDLLEALTRSGDGGTATISEDWLQGRSCFGGLQSALAVRAMRRLVPAALPLRSLQTVFVGPLGAGVVRITAQLLRAGRTATHIEARLHGADGELAALVVGIFGAARVSQLAITAPAPVVAKPPEQSRELPYLPGLTPAFLQHMRLRWAAGGFPYSGQRKAHAQVHVEFRDEPLTGEAQTIALADAIPSPALALLTKPTPASSLTWTLELLGDVTPRASAPWLMDAEVSAGADGYLAQSASLWNDAGQLVCLSRQSVVVFG